jgi:hypothetical protein
MAATYLSIHNWLHSETHSKFQIHGVATPSLEHKGLSVTKSGTHKSMAQGHERAHTCILGKVF